MDLKKCSKCKVFLVKSMFYNNKTKWDKLCSECKKCQDLNNEKAYQKWYDSDKRKVYYRNYTKKKRQDNLQYKLRDNLKRTLNQALNHTKGTSILKYIDCTLIELKQHLEAKFQPGMTWENYGRTGWHIDHIRPLASFDLTQETEIYLAMKKSNLQPLWRFDNQSKGKKIVDN